MDKKTKEKTHSVLFECVTKTIKRIQDDDGFRPFHEALLTKEILKASQFERSFSTSFGQGAIEDISKIVAEGNGFIATKQYELQIDVTKSALDECERILSALRSGDSQPNWTKEVSRVTALQKGDRETRRIIADLHLLAPSGREIFLTIKTVKPNLDQTQEAKRLMLNLKAHNSDFDTYLGLYYNPTGDRQSDYSWTVPNKVFNMRQDPCVLIGAPYWDFLGGVGTYQELLEIFQRVGLETREALRKANLF